MVSKQNKGIYQIVNNLQSNDDMASSMKNMLLKMRNKGLQESLSDFEGSEHKLEMVTTIKEIDFINDSSSTTLNGVWFALSSMTRNTTWITSANDLNGIVSRLHSQIEEKVKVVVLLGVYDTSIHDYFLKMGKEVITSMNMEEAVRAAFYKSKPNDVILFSPGVVSGGNYITYRERGKAFKNAVAQL